MVGIDGSNTDFILGKTSVKPESLAPDEWAVIIRDTLERLNMKHLQGMQSIRQILCPEIGINERYGVNEVRSEMAPGTLTFGAVPISLRINSTFLDLTSIIPRPLWSAWPKDKLLAPSLRLILSRDKEVYLLDTTWRRRERETSESRRDLWFETENVRIDVTGLQEVLDRHPTARWGEYDSAPLGLRILQRFFLSLRETERYFENWHSSTEENTQQLQACLNRLGVPL